MLEPNEGDLELELVGMMVSDLPRLKALSSTCPKCGETGAFNLKKEYCDSLDCYDDGAEHLHVRCDKCGYIRDTQCADAPEPSGAADAGTGVAKVEPLAAPAQMEGDRLYG